MAERVYTCSDFYDRPLSGSADFEGRPHWYKCRFDEVADDYEPWYELTPLRADILAAEIEHDAIFRAWHAARIAGETDHSTYPALPYHRARYEALSEVIEQFLKSADFAVRAHASWKREQSAMVVDWTKIST